METYPKYITASLTAIIAVLFLVGAVMAGTTDTAPTTATVNVNEFLSMTLTSGAPVTFPSMDPNQGPTSASNNPLTATIGSESNVNTDVATKTNQTNFDGPGTLAVSNMEWSDTIDGTNTSYTTSDAEVCGSVIAGSACNIYHRLTVPGATAAGSYSAYIIITATKA